MKLHIKTLLAAFFALAMAFAIQAQTTGSVTGTITDPNGAVVPAAKVTLTNQATRAELTATTNDAGGFNFIALQPGIYTVSVAASGFKRTQVPNIAVEVSKSTQLTIPLTIGIEGETVTVTGAQDVVNTSSPSLTNVINTRQVTDLPLPTRNPLDLASLQAGIAVVGDNTRGASVGGLRQTSTNVTQDGINAMDNFVKTSSFFAISSPSLNSVSEFSITTNTVGSEAGRGVGQVNLVTKGGSNEFHGGFFYLHRNDLFNANTWFNNHDRNEREKIRQHFFGFDIGGPVYFLNFGDGGPKIFNGKDRAFFFFSYEGFRENFSTSVNRTVLTQSARQGMFKYAGGTQQVDLLSIGSVNALNPITMALLNSTPLPNNTSCSANDTYNISCFRYNVTGSDPNDKYVARYDHQLVKHSSYGAHKLEVVMNRAHFFLGPDTFNGIQAPFPGGVNAFQESKRWLVTGALVSNFGSNITNVFRYGKQWAPVGFLRESNPTTPFVLFSGITNPDNTFMSQGRDTIVDQYTDNASWAHGKHLFRFGGDYQKIFADTFNDAGINQTITLGRNSQNEVGFDSDTLTWTDSEFERARSVYVDIVGNLASSAQTLNVASPDSGFVAGATRARLFREQDLALYGQDQWRMRSNLTVNAGVRWEFLGVPTIPNGLAIQLTDADQVWGISGSGNIFNPNASIGPPPAVGVLDFVSGNTGVPLYKDDWNNFAPFAGIAWAPDFKKGFLHAIFGSAGRSSVRLGYSVSYLHDGFTTISNALGVGTTNAGLIQTRSLTTPVGVLGPSGVTLPSVSFNIPRSDRQNFLASSSNGVWAIDPNIKIPYVQQWNVGYEREIFPNTAFEVRYVGNHGVKVWRAVDLNEVNIFENGFLNEFLAAQQNLALYRQTFPNCNVNDPNHPENGFPCRFGNSNLPGQVSLPWMERFFRNFSPTSGSGFASSGFIANLNANNVGTFASSLAFSNTYRTNRECVPAPNNNCLGIPANFFVVNPNAAFARILTNDSMSNYHALEVELRRRFSSGLQFQADYTFSKAMTDAPGALGNNQSDLTSFRTQRDKRLDYTRSSQDQTHRFVANVLYELPFGKGRYWFSDANSIVNHVIGGWNVGSIVTWSTRPPWYVVSGRTTFNNFNSGSAPAQLNGITFEEFRSHVGLFRTADGVYFIDPEFIQRIQDEELIAAPGPGEWGNFPINSLSGPRYFNVDMSLTKRWSVTERVRLELKTTFINILNHPNFAFGNQTFDSSSFGRITGTSGSERIIHFTGSLRF